MEARSLTQKDLWKIFGSKGSTSEVFHGKRSISKTQAKRLAEFFHVSAELKSTKGEPALVEIWSASDYRAGYYDAQSGG
jgi:HTH-type transcriptional regulator/antitoxin HigA